MTYYMGTYKGKFLEIKTLLKLEHVKYIIRPLHQIARAPR